MTIAVISFLLLLLMIGYGQYYDFGSLK